MEGGAEGDESLSVGGEVGIGRGRAEAEQEEDDERNGQGGGDALFWGVWRFHGERGLRIDKSVKLDSGVLGINSSSQEFY